MKRKRVDGMYRIRMGIRPETPFPITSHRPRTESKEERNEGVYTVFMDYVSPPPPMEKLEKCFSGLESVSRIFDGRPWTRDVSCREINEHPGERIFRLASVSHQMFGKRIDEVRRRLAEKFALEGFRFAIESEAIAFSLSHPELQNRFDILALGSYVQDDEGNDYVVRLHKDGAGRLLEGFPIHERLFVNMCLLMTTKRE